MQGAENNAQAKEGLDTSIIITSSSSSFPIMSYIDSATDASVYGIANSYVPSNPPVAFVPTQPATSFCTNVLSLSLRSTRSDKLVHRRKASAM